MSIERLNTRLTCAADVTRVVRGSDIAIAIVDRPMQIVEWVNAGIVAAGVPTIFGGVDTTRGVQYTVLPGESGCVECWRHSATAKSAHDAELLDKRATARYEGNDAAFGPLVTTVTGMIVNEFVRLATGVAPCVGAGRLLEYRFEDGMIACAEDWDRNDQCRTCGPGGGI